MVESLKGALYEMLAVDDRMAKTTGATLNVCPVGAAHGRRLLARRQVPDGQVSLLPIGAIGRREVRGFGGAPTDMPWITASKGIIRD
jgi:hypothetical protein